MKQPQAPARKQRIMGMGFDAAGFRISSDDESYFLHTPIDLHKVPDDVRDGIQQIAAGFDSCFVLSNGSVYSWGASGATLGRVEDEDNEHCTFPCTKITEVSGAPPVGREHHEFVKVATAGSSLALLEKDGSLFLAGAFTDGTNKFFRPRRTPDDGVLGRNDVPHHVPLPGPAVDIIVGGTFLLVLLKTGELWSFGTFCFHCSRPFVDSGL